MALPFAGTFEHTVDKKQRLAIPAEHRSIVRQRLGQPEGPVSFYVTLGGEGTLCLFTEPDFAAKADELAASDQGDESDIAAYEMLFGTSRRVEMDRNGRILVPETLSQMAGLNSDVVLIGMNDHIQIRNREAWQAFISGMMNRRTIANPRAMVRRQGSARQAVDSAGRVDATDSGA